MELTPEAKARLAEAGKSLDVIIDTVHILFNNPVTNLGDVNNRLFQVGASIGMITSTISLIVTELIGDEQQAPQGEGDVGGDRIVDDPGEARRR